MTDQLFWFTTRGAGIVSLLFLTGVVYLGVLAAHPGRPGPGPGSPRWVPRGPLLAVVFLGVHIVTAVIDPFTSLGPLAALVPFSSAYRTLWLGLGVLALDLAPRSWSQPPEEQAEPSDLAGGALALLCGLADVAPPRLRDGHRHPRPGWPRSTSPASSPSEPPCWCA